MKKKQVMVSLAIIGSLGGCSDENVQRDVYQSVEECMLDWQYRELCEPQQEEQYQYTESTSSSGSSYRSSSSGYRSNITFGNSPDVDNTHSNTAGESATYNGFDDGSHSPHDTADGSNTHEANAHSSAHGSSGHYSGTHAAMAGAAAGGAAAYAVHRATSGKVFGPTYHPDTREVRMNDGRTVKPYTNHSRNPIIVKGAAANNPNSKPISRGGFKGFFNGKSGG